MKRIDYYLSIVVLLQMVMSTVQLLLPLLGMATEEIASKYRIYITLLTYLPGFFYVLRRSRTYLFLSFFIFFSVLIINSVLFPETNYYINSSQAYALTPIAILTILFISSIKQVDCLFKSLLWISRLSVLLALVYIVAFNVSPLRDVTMTYSMSFGYTMLLPAMFLIMQRNPVDMMFSLLLFIIILLGGSRGPVAVLLLYYIYELFCSSRKIRLRYLLPCILIIGLLFIKFVPSDILETSRTFAVLSSDKGITYDSGRSEELYSFFIPKIFQKPIFGWGIGADRFFLDGGYVHNVFIELAFHYGVIVTFIVIILFLMKLYKLYNRCQNSEYLSKDFVVLLFMYGFIPLLVSGSYLTNLNFSIMLGTLLLFDKLLKKHNKRVVLTFKQEAL